MLEILATWRVANNYKTIRPRGKFGIDMITDQPFIQNCLDI